MLASSFMYVKHYLLNLTPILNRKTNMTYSAKTNDIKNNPLPSKLYENYGANRLNYYLVLNVNSIFIHLFIISYRYNTIES